MELPTKDDIEQCIKMMGQHIKLLSPSEFQNGLEIARRIKNLLSLYDKTGLPVREIDIHLLGHSEDRHSQGRQIHSFAVGDLYKLLPEDKAADLEWKIDELKAHIAHR